MSLSIDTRLYRQCQFRRVSILIRVDTRRYWGRINIDTVNIDTQYGQRQNRHYSCSQTTTKLFGVELIKFGAEYLENVDIRETKIHFGIEIPHVLYQKI